MGGEKLTTKQPIPLRLTHGNLNIAGLKIPTTFDDLLSQKKLLTEALERYFEGTSVFSELKEGDENIAETRTSAKDLCLEYDSKESIETDRLYLVSTYGEVVVKISIEHFNDSGAGDIAMLRGAIEMELEAEKREMDPKLMVQVEAGKADAAKTMMIGNKSNL